DEKQTRLVFFYASAGVNTNPKLAPPPRPAGTTAPVATPQPPPKWHVYLWDRNGKTTPGAGLPLAPGAFSTLVSAGVAAKAQATSPATEVFNPATPGQKI